MAVGSNLAALDLGRQHLGVLQWESYRKREIFDEGEESGVL